jgi:hypothetical protein
MTICAATLAAAQQIPHTPGQIPPYVDPNNPPFQLPPGSGDPLDRLYPGPLRPDPVPDRQTPVGPPWRPAEPPPAVVPPAGLPGFTMTIRRDPDNFAPGALSRARQVGEHLAACWRPPADGVEVTVRVSFNRAGEVIGERRVTYVKAADGAGRAEIVRSVDQAFARCLPLRFTRDLGSAIAGRPFALRFIAAGAARP